MSTWSQRDLPVLYWLQENPPPHSLLSTNLLQDNPHSALPELCEQDVHVSVETLADDGLVTYADQQYEEGGGVDWTQFQVSGAGLQALGEWPVFDMLGTPHALGRLLDALAEMAASDEEESSLRTAASAARSKGVETLRSAASGALRGVLRSQILG